jgi:hypothetical protein
MALDTGSTPTHTASTPSFPVPASARVHPTTTPTIATATPSATTPATTTPVAPVTTAPAATTPAKATVPTLTTPSSVAKPTTTTGVGPPAAHTVKHSESLSTAAIAAVVLAVVLVLACIVWALARRRAFEPHWLLSLRHAIAEAGFRLSATCAEFADWLRLGH